MLISSKTEVEMLLSVVKENVSRSKEALSDILIKTLIWLF